MALSLSHLASAGSPSLALCRTGFDKDIKQMVLRHEVRILERQLHGRVRYRQVVRVAQREAVERLDLANAIRRFVSGAPRARTGGWLGRA